MNISDILKISAVCGLLAAPLTSDAQTFVVDGYANGDDSYTNQTAIYFYNGHDNSTYGTKDNPIYQTYLRWGYGKLASDPIGADFLFVYVETPLEAKNMVWGNDVTPEEALQYNDNMDYNKATGSEHIQFIDSTGTQILRTNLKDNNTTFDKGDFGFLEVKSSVDYLFSNGATEASSGDGTVDAHNIGMAFEWRFALNEAENAAFLNVLRDDGVINYHLSPDRGLVPTQVPEPTSALMALMGGAALLIRRKR